ATGVAFTRNPATGEKEFYGEFLINAQGEDVVAGIRTPEPISRLKELMPEVYAQLEDIYQRLEQHYKEMQDIEFTIQEGRLYMLQTRTGKRTAQAAIRIAVDMVDEGLIDERTALKRVPAGQLDQLLHKQIDPKEKVDVLTTGLPASPGAAVGRIVFTADDAEAWAARGEDVILVRRETSPEDIGGMHAAGGILTARGGMTSRGGVGRRPRRGCPRWGPGGRGPGGDRGGGGRWEGGGRGGQGSGTRRAATARGRAAAAGGETPASRAAAAAPLPGSAARGVAAKT